MYELDFQDWIFLPVMFRVLNADGYGDYFNGLTVDKIADDGIDNDWGDETEPCLSQAFYYISFGTFDNSVIAYAKSASEDFPGKTPLKKLDLLLFNN